MRKSGKELGLAQLVALDRACTAYGLPTEPTEHGLLRVGGVGGSQGRHREELWRQRGRRSVLPLGVRQNSLEETSQRSYSPRGELRHMMMKP